MDSDEVWTDFDDICTRTKRGEVVSNAAVNRCSLVITAAILVESWQRPSAITNCTFNELKAAKLVTRGMEQRCTTSAATIIKLGGRGWRSFCWTG